jgi:LmbE family N-acetylglucosaminyl deacetylase
MEFPARHFPTDRQAILDEMIRSKKLIEPDIVFLPASTDTHQDHHVIYEEGVRAFKNCSVLGCEMPWNMTEFTPKCFWSVDDSNLDAKLAALGCYKSQGHRPYMAPDFIRSLARVRGVQCGNDLAEAFEVIRWNQ